MTVPPEILKLVERFREQHDAYVSGDYNETQLRRDFLDPFLRALGWDVDNQQGNAEQYREVVHEDKVLVGGESKAPDYSCRIGGVRKFFVEAKKPGVDLKNDPKPAFQLRRYGWSARLPVSLLTNFEEFAVYDTRPRPSDKDKASTGRILYLTYDQYAERWDEIAGLFSREAVLKGAFDRYADGKKGRKGTATVDDAFLEEIEGWRTLLAKDLARENPKLDADQLNFAVQRTLDRIIFLRICEDRRIEDYGQLGALVNGLHIYGRLKELFDKADRRYNSGLFHFREEAERHESPDALTLRLKIGDKTLKEIITGLYYPAPWAFDVIPADILGHIYEQFLGKTIRLTAGHQVKVEEKPEVRKAGGVYYTPTYIVDYIVKETVGKLLEGKTPKEAAEIKILDPACGSGSFLIGAYQYLLDWHREWYVQDGPEKHKKELYEASKGEWRLTTKVRKQILLNSVYGVDIDPQAVEVTKLSLLLKVLEGETGEALQYAFQSFHERALPDLGENVKCGNSLVEPGLELLSNIDASSDAGLPFAWSSEFPLAMNRTRPGFDAVIGNPPYVRQEALKRLKGYFEQAYESFAPGADLLVYFFERGIRLLRSGGRLGFIASSSFLRAGYGQHLRSLLSRKAHLESILDFGGYPVFDGAKDTYVCIPVFTISSGTLNRQPVRAAIVDSGPRGDLARTAGVDGFLLDRARLGDDAWPIRRPAEFEAFDRIRGQSLPLLEVLKGKLYYGLKTGLNRAFVVPNALGAELVRENSIARALVHSWFGGEHIRSFHISESGEQVIAIPSGWTRQHLFKGSSRAPAEREAWVAFAREVPAIAAHLAAFASEARKRDDQGDYWWELRPCDYYDVLEGHKLVFPDIAKGARFAVDDGGSYLGNTGYCAPVADRALLAYLNSAVAWFTISMTSIPFGFRAGAYRYRLIYQYMAPLPIPRKVAVPAAGGEGRQALAALGRAMEDLCTSAETDDVARFRQLAALQAELDAAVFDLLGSSDSERAVIGRAASVTDEDDRP